MKIISMLVGNIPIELNAEMVANEIVLPIIEKAISKILQQYKTSDSYLTRDEAAKLLGISLPTLDKYTKEGALTKYSLGNTDLQRYKASEINLAWKAMRFKS